MESREIDQLFKEKLESFEKEPSHMAWNKLQAQLPGQKKKLPLFWTSAAASLSLLAVSFFIYQHYVVTNKHSLVAISKQAEEIKEETTEETAPSAPVAKGLPRTMAEAAPPYKEKRSPRQTNAQTKQTTIQTPALASKTTSPPDVVALQKDVDEETMDAHNTTKKIKESVVEDPVPVETTKPSRYTRHVAPDSRNLSLTFDIGELALAASSEIASPEENEDRSERGNSVVKKIFGFASGLKNGENGFGDLREAKNGLIASVIKKKKERTERSN